MKKLRKPYFCGRCFYNHEGESHTGFYIRSLKMLFRHYALGEGKPPKGASCWIEKSEPASCSVEPIVTWLGHASFLVQVGGMNILIDPIFGDISFLYRRILPVAVPFSKIPSVDFVLISHNHIDHMDSSSLKAIRKKNENVTVLVPKGDKLWFDKRRFKSTYENMWWEQRSFALKHDASKKITFSFLPAAHWSQRGLFDKNKSLWGSWMIECCGHQIYFAGDTCYSAHFSEIANEFPNIDLALMPVGPCEPREWLQEWHLGVREAMKSFLELGAKHMIPMHWGTFPFGVEYFDAPVNLLRKLWQENLGELGGKQLHCNPIGRAFKILQS